MGKPDAPTPPNPLTTAAAQTSTNVQSAVANAFLNNTNQQTPTGSLDYNVTGNYGWTDPTTGQTYNIPRFTATQTLTPEGQAIQAQTLATQLNMAGMANAQSQKISQLLSNGMDLSGAPSAGNANNILNVPGAATSYASGGPIQMGINQPGGMIATTYGPGDFSQDAQSTQDALMARMQPQLDLSRQRLQQQLADQGIQYGSDAYNNAMFTQSQQENDAHMAAVSQGYTTQQQLINEAAQQAAFQNEAQNQAYQQQIGMGGFANQAQAQQTQQNAAAASFQNVGLAQQLQQQTSGFNAQQAALNQYLQQQFALRDQPINEITSLLSGSQVQQPNFINTPGAQIPTTDISGLINQNFNQQQQNYQTQTQQYNTLVGGVLGLGAGALKLSDVREKEDIHKVGTVFSAHDGDDLPIYSYRYKATGKPDVGPMAQDVERMDPSAVRTVKGRKYIDQSKMMGNLLRAA
jgi:Chaperone of endosialidase